jgi:xanthine dehydrogenase YagS FAD-binding subunit
MNAFQYARANHVAAAVATVSGEPRAAFIAGGTEQLNLLKDRIQTLSLLVDINALPLTAIETGPDFLRIGALARMGDIAAEPAVRDAYPVLSQALLSAASPQVRNMAAIGGNLLQRTRCPYFRVGHFACNRRDPGSGCAAIGGENRWHAIFGGSEHCIAVHPSDPAVALLALDAIVVTEAPSGSRRIPLASFYRLPGDTPQRETVLEHGELIVAIELPAAPGARRSAYLKVRDRASFEFALVSVAAALHLEDGVVREARLALGGVAPVPWRARAAEEALRGQPIEAMTITRAAETAVADATPQPGNGFKVELARRAVARALAIVGDLP